MVAESIVQADDSPVAQIRKPDKVEALDVALLDMPVKETPDIGSPDSVLSANLRDNSGEIASKPAVESFTLDTVNNVNGSDNADTVMSTSTEATTMEDEKDDAHGRQNSGEAAGVDLLPTVEIKEDTGDEDSIIKTDEAVESPIVIVQSSMAKESIVHEIQEMEEISLEDGENKVTVKGAGENKSTVKGEGEKKGISALALEPIMKALKAVEIGNIKPSTPVLEEAEKGSKQSTAAAQGDEPKQSTADLRAAEGNIKEDVMAKNEAPVVELQPVATETPAAESQAKGVSKAVERTEREEKLASAIEALPSSRFARASETQEASEPSTPPTPERSGAVIKLTRQMSRVSTGMGPMSPRFEIRAAKEIQDLQEKVKVMEEELRRKAAVIETQSFNLKERENELLNKIECLELANEQLLQGGNDSSIQLQMELTRLQRQNSVLQLRERELQFQINTQEMIKTQMLEQRPAKTEPVNPVKQLESKIAILESKLAEAVEVSNMYKIQLHEAFTRQKSVQSAALLNLGDGEELLKELQKLRKQTKEQETELTDLQDRFFITTVRLAESAAQKEELLSKLKRLQGGK